MLSSYFAIFSEIYMFGGLFLLTGIGVFIGLSNKLHYPVIYNGVVMLTILLLSNCVIIDINVNNFVNYVSFDFHKNNADILIKLILFITTILFFVYTHAYMKKSKLNRLEYPIIIYLTLFSFTLFIISIDLLSFYLLLEIQSISFYILTAFNKKNQYSVESGLKYFILSSFSSIILLFGFSFIYGITGITNFQELYLFFSIVEYEESYLFTISVPILMILIALLFKVYAAPFHMWISDIYQGAPHSTTAFFATLSSLPVFYVLTKLYLISFYFVTLHFTLIIFAISICSMLFGMAGAIYQKKIKRLIAFSSVSNIGYVLLCLLQHNPMLISHALTYFVVYIINLIGIFAVFLSFNLGKINNSIERITLLAELVSRNNLLAFSLSVFFFTLAGIPPFSLFISKALLLSGLTYSLFSIILFVIIFSAIVSGFYYLRIVKYINFDKKRNWFFLHKISYANALLIMYILFFNCFFFLDPSIITLFTDYIALTIY